MAEDKLVSRSEDFNEWYNTLVLRADLADYGPVRGTMIIKPYGWTLWENMQQALDRRFKATGHLNAGFPMLIPRSFIDREASHVEGFSPELAVVTVGGGKELEEPLVVRPTSETIIGYAYSKWIKSYRDLPVLINLWNSVVRWELRTKLFLRTQEFWWQEGHTAHATHAEAQAETLQMLDVYLDFARNEAALPAYTGRKSASEKFPGADVTYSLEAVMGDGKALQAATSHNLGQNFARAFDIKYLDRGNELQHCWTTSWGLSTRFIGAIVMAHGDDQGLVLPPRLAPHQAVIVPIYKSEEEQAMVLEACQRVRAMLADAGVRVIADLREGLSPGFKFNDWEMRGVPLRIEIGPKDVAKESVALARRDIPGKAGKSFVPVAGLAAAIIAKLDEIQQNMLARATEFRDANTSHPRDFAGLAAAVVNGFARAWSCGKPECDAAIKEQTKATNRCIPLDQVPGGGPCVYCGEPATEQAYFARAY
ncbi:MAG: proline--tRNA ligase [Chloroflexi bacterium]|nr:proline--tRNA ligase [Chloroflexota bacterium]